MAFDCGLRIADCGLRIADCEKTNNVVLMQWIGENYCLSARFDSANSRNAKLGDKLVFILAYERNP